MYQPNEGEFRKLLAEALTKMEEIAPEFCKYFVSNYVVDDKVKFWATCFRRGAIVNTNMHVEALNRVLKDVYFRRKQNRRVDELLFVLLKLAVTELSVVCTKKRSHVCCFLSLTETSSINQHSTNGRFFFAGTGTRRMRI